LIISSQIFSTCVSDFDFSPAAIVISFDENFFELKFSDTRLPNNRAEV